VNLAFVEARLDGERVRGRFALQFGTSVQANYAGEPHIGHVSGPSVSQYIQEAFIGYKLSPTLWVDGGVFFAHTGLEGWISRDNLAYTRSMVADFSPYYEAGVKLTWTPSPAVTGPGPRPQRLAEHLELQHSARRRPSRRLRRVSGAHAVVRQFLRRRGAGRSRGAVPPLPRFHCAAHAFEPLAARRDAVAGHADPEHRRRRDRSLVRVHRPRQIQGHTARERGRATRAVFRPSSGDRRDGPPGSPSGRTAPRSGST
jgi:hypothetical protein